MIDLNNLLQYYPKPIAENAAYHKYILKEYVELLALEYITQSVFAPQLVFIGGTCLRLVHGIDRFSEDLDFDCKNLTPEGFQKMTDTLIAHLRAYGMNVEARDKDNPHLTAYRRNIYFPELLFDMKLTGHKEERFLMKIEAQDQGVGYHPQTAIVSRNGFLFPVSVPSKSVLLSMKLAALMARTKGRDFYDTIFLWQQVEPDYDFLSQRCGICDPAELKAAIDKKLSEVNLDDKQRDLEHLLFSSSGIKKILYFKDFVASR